MFSCFVVGDVGGASGKVLTNSAGVVRGGIRRKLYFFHPNPFEGEREMLVESKLGVWDLDGEKRLTGLLESLEVPFAGVAVPEGFAGGVLLVSGLCLERHPGAPEMLFSLAEGGMKVIVVSLHSGRFILPLQGMSCFSIGGAEVISGALGQKGTSLGKDILATVFREYSDTAEPGLELVAFSEAVALGLPGRATGDEVKGFAFCEIRTRKSLEGHSGRIIFLGGDIVGRAGMSPAPAYLLNELLRP